MIQSPSLGLGKRLPALSNIVKGAFKNEGNVKWIREILVSVLFGHL